MKERPMIFSGPMMRAIREDRKTQTRRIIKPQPVYVAHEDEGGHVEWSCPKYNSLQVDDFEDLANYAPVKPGDLIWCRETWIEGFPTGEPDRWSSIRPTGYEGHGRAFYRADDDDPPDEPRRNWRSSMFMPRWASRETLRVLSVRPEGVRDISAEDCQAEGIEVPRCGCDVCSVGSAICPADATAYIMEFRNQWDWLHAKSGHPWDSNPWVWRYEFARVK